MNVVLSNGQVALVDDDDYDIVKDVRWYQLKKGYAVSTLGLMHRLIIGHIPSGRYRATIWNDGQKISLGTYDSFDSAVHARKRGEAKYNVNVRSK